MEVTTIEQSKRLIELGIDPKTADLVYPAWTLSETPTEDELSIIDGTLEDDDIPSWSLSALMNLMPKIEFYKDEYHYVPCIERYKDNLLYLCENTPESLVRGMNRKTNI